ncbi:hypothetical protein EJC49_15525 [Aquibium carbonis]|uniref:Uncharacterized protein n=1 Tax=Aquibium carbonis TaxID=2495581 RepID=A0A3R9YE11_9HYPH|nr:hypothetical protein [Aquibium carbonis]RST85496.1 hypothetical protein EJC49_15525 [Aquibium carbonis]
MNTAAGSRIQPRHQPPNPDIIYDALFGTNQQILIHEMNPPDDPLRALHDPSCWDAGHPVSQAFERLAEEVRRRRETGIGRLSAKATPTEADFERSRLARRAATFASGEPSSNADLASIGATTWGNPVSAILYAAAQATAHHILRDRTLDEPAVNSAVHETLPRRLSDLAQAYKLARCGLPPGKCLHAGSAKMERTRDHMGADLALVVGANVLGLPRFRVVLVQAKHADGHQRTCADVGRNQGKQLDDLLSTGMGYYLFYPRAVADADGRHTRLLPALRSAPAVFADVATATGASNRYMVGCHARRDGTVDATDFAEFIALSMASDELGVGRLFPCAQSAAASLVVKGEPLVPEVFAVDRTGSLSVLEFLDAMRGHGLETTADAPFTTYEELKVDHEPDFSSSPLMR